MKGHKMNYRNQQKYNEVGPDSAGQSGATQQISGAGFADSQSVEELIEEGNAFEANVIYGIEKAEDDDVSEVTTHEVPQDDVPGEYVDDGRPDSDS